MCACSRPEAQVTKCFVIRQYGDVAAFRLANRRNPWAAMAAIAWRKPQASLLGSPQARITLGNREILSAYRVINLRAARALEKAASRPNIENRRDIARHRGARLK